MGAAFAEKLGVPVEYLRRSVWYSLECLLRLMTRVRDSPSRSLKSMAAMLVGHEGTFALKMLQAS